MLLGLASAAAWYYQKSRQQPTTTEPSVESTNSLDTVNIADVADLNERITAGMWSLHKKL